MLPPDEARRILADISPVGIESVPLRAAGGRVLAVGLTAPEHLPAHPRSVMDGYAVRAGDVAGASDAVPTVLRVVGIVPMGGVFAGSVAPGQAVAISTGGFVPAGADAVVMIEVTSPAGDVAAAGDAPTGVAIRRPVSAGANIIQPGEDLRAGDALAARGRRLRPADLAALATFGFAEVSVYRRPRIAILSTGNELCQPHETPALGQVRDVNQAVLAAQTEAAGCAVTYGGIIRDDAAALRDAVGRLLATHDGLILSGGSSVGVKDVSSEALAGLAEPGVLFHGIDIRPGKPTLFARSGAKPVIGMPGFPTSSMIVFDAFIRPMLWRLGGELHRDPWPSRRRARLARPYVSTVGREDYLRVRLVDRDGEDWAEPLAGGSAAISNVVQADGLIRVDAARERIGEGDFVEVFLY
ncbi:MAG TPA: gephyrin-like molybdotransferase Glp [Polyangia bacterium]|nr:gephyrin-like molybdotransferase Glp [Polyangia bacterium]